MWLNMHGHEVIAESQIVEAEEMGQEEREFTKLATVSNHTSDFEEWLRE